MRFWTLSSDFKTAARMQCSMIADSSYANFISVTKTHHIAQFDSHGAASQTDRAQHSWMLPDRVTGQGNSMLFLPIDRLAGTFYVGVRLFLLSNGLSYSCPIHSAKAHLANRISLAAAKYLSSDSMPIFQTSGHRNFVKQQFLNNATRARITGSGYP